jgi:hypothetical protein
MSDQTARGYNAIQITYALTAAKLSKDELGAQSLLPEKPLDCLDALESTLVACYLTLKELPENGYNPIKLSKQLQNALAIVNNDSNDNGNLPLSTYLAGKKNSQYKDALLELVTEFTHIWEARWPQDGEALGRAREVCAINMQFSIKN